MNSSSENRVGETLRILNLEDNPNDSELIQAELETAWQTVELLRVETREEFARALDEFKPDIVLCDFKLTDINGSDALDLVRHTHPYIPVIMVTGVLCDIEAVNLVKQGAKDYVMKDHLRRLTAAVQSALSQEQGIRERKAVEKALQESEADIRALVEHSPIAMIVDTGSGSEEKVILMNRKFTELFGYTLKDIPTVQHWWPRAYPDEQYRELIRAKSEKLAAQAVRDRTKIEPFESAVTCKDGTVRHVRISFASTGSKNIVTFENLTEHKLVKARILRLNQLYAALSHCNQAIVHSKNEQELFARICEVAVRFGGMNMAWIGRVDPATRMVIPVASYGDGAAEYLHDIKISADAGSPYGQGPTGRSLYEKRPLWCQDFQNSPLTTPWHQRGAALGWNSSAALPLYCNGAAYGTFTLYSDRLNAFDETVRDLLIEMSADISHALDTLSQEALRVQMEQELENSRNLLKTVIDTSPVRIFWKDRESRYLGCNPAFARDAGENTPANIIGKIDDELSWHAQAELYRADDRQVMNSGIAKISYDEPQTTPEGKMIWLRTSKVPLRNAAGEAIGILGIYEDITERKLTELALRRSEAELKRAQAVAQIGSWNLDVNTGRFEWSEESHRIFGIPGTEAVTLDTFISTVHPDDRERVLKAWNAAVAGATYDIEHRIVVDGQTRWVRERAVIERDADGRALFGVGTTQDISARKQAEDELRKLSLAVEQSPNSIMITDLNANLEYVNDAFVRTTGYSRADVIGKNSRILHSGKNSRATYKDMWAHLTRGEMWQGELINRRKNGSEYIESILISPVRDSNGNVSHYLGIKEDITERKRVEKSLQESEEKFRIMTASAQDAIVMINNDGNISFWNAAAENIFGYPAQDALGKDLHQLLAPARFREKSAQGFARFLLNGEGTVIGKTLEFVALHKNGNEFPIELSLSAVKISERWHAIGIIRDISERKQIEEKVLSQFANVASANAQLTEANKQLEQAKNQLLQSEKMAAIGLLAAGVAHEINNPVGYVNSNLGSLEKYMADIFVVLDKYEAAEALNNCDNPLQEDLRKFKEKINLNYIREDTRALISESHQGLDRVKKIILDLKDFSRSNAAENWGWANVQQGLESTLNVVWNELKYKCEVIKEFAPLPQIYCLPSQLNQVFMNLLVNAAQAIEVRGKITLRSGTQDDRIWIEISDTGKGIPAEIIPLIFNPFFTTKPIGKGTGLGLSVSYKIIEKHRGTIEVHSEVGIGSTFRIWLPIQPPEEKA
jgi:PAS domain S-box-containing protein